jgi:hypothetical protein
METGFLCPISISPDGGANMRDYKTTIIEEGHEDELRPFIATSLGVSENVLAKHPFKRDEWTLRWLENGPPKGVVAAGGITEIDPPTN